MARTAKPKALLLRLYVAGRAPNSVHAIANARAICAEYFPDRSELEIVDLLVNPRRALEDGIIVTPTLLKLSPRPIARVVGDLSDAAQVLLTLSSK